MTSRTNKIKNKNKKTSSAPLRILLKCSWSGARLPINTSTGTNDASKTIVSLSSTIYDAVSSVSSQLPPSIFHYENNGNGNSGSGGEMKGFETEASIIYMRTTVWRRDWERATIKDILGADASEGGSVLLTLNLPKVATTFTPNATETEAGARTETVSNDTGLDSLNATTSSTAVNTSVPEPMDVEMAKTTTVSSDNVHAAASKPSPPPTTTTTTSGAPPPVVPTPQKSKTPTDPQTAIQTILSSNFDSDSKECIQTLLKILDNVLSKPNDPKVRSIKLSNAAFHRKVASKKGGIDLLLTVGFTPVASIVLGTVSNQNPSVESIALAPKDENERTLLDARGMLVHALVHELHVSQREVPTLKRPVAATSTTTTTAKGTTKAFDPFRPHAFNTQSAAVGAPNPNSIVPDGTASGTLSTTERQLEQLKEKQSRLEKKMQEKMVDRDLVAFLPGQQVSAVSGGGDESFGGGGGGGSGGDGGLLASRMKRMEEERKKREEGGFTTKAMRDLEKMKKAKVYSHAQLRINFPDGSYLSCKFHPSETIAMLKQVVQSAFVDELRPRLSFDIYVAPPRRVLKQEKTLTEEGLVPAAKVHVSWKVNGAPAVGAPPGSVLRRELFRNHVDVASGGGKDSFPDAKSIVGNSEARKGGGSKGSSSRVEDGTGNGGREEELMQRMMGKKKGFFGKKGGASGGNTLGSGGNGKPKWFKG